MKLSNSMWCLFLIVYCSIGSLQANPDIKQIDYFQHLDSIPPANKNLKLKVVERVDFDTIATFNTDTFEETIKVVRTVRHDTIQLLEGNITPSSSNMTPEPAFKTIEDSIPAIYYKEIIDTIVIFDPETYEETVKIVKRMVKDSVLVSNKVNRKQSNLWEPERATDHEPVFKIVEQMPRFPGCEHLGVGMKEVDDCAREKLLDFIYGNLEYPHIAKENGVEGTVVLQFVVRKDGAISDINVVRDIGAACGDASIRVIEKMNTMEERWIPGTQRGQKVNVQYTLPIRFKAN